MEHKFDNNIPIYLQIVDIIKLDIISGKIRPGEKLHSVRIYANMLQVNPNTMQKALMELEDLKLIYTERTNGKYVTNDTDLIEKYKIKLANKIINKYFKDMELIGIEKNKAIKYIEKDGKI